MDEFNIDPNFSLYALLQRRQTDDRLLSHRVTMSRMSYLIEEATRHDHEANIIFSAFQYLSKFMPQIERYREIAHHARHVYVFGVPDVAPPALPNITYVPLSPNDRLTSEWFIVSHGPDFSTALATEELSAAGTADHERQFSGIVLFDEDLVNILANWLYRTVGKQSDLDQPGTSVNMRRRVELVHHLSAHLSDMIANTPPGTTIYDESVKFHQIAQQYLNQAQILSVIGKD